MATIESAVHDYLITKTTVTSYVGLDIYFCAAPSSIDTDFIRYQIVAPSNEPVEFSDKLTAQPTFQFDAFSKDASRCLAIGDALVTLLHGFSGTLVTGLEVTTSTATGPQVMRDPDEQWYHGIVEWEVEYKR